MEFGRTTSRPDRLSRDAGTHWETTQFAHNSPIQVQNLDLLTSRYWTVEASQLPRGRRLGHRASRLACSSGCPEGAVLMQLCTNLPRLERLFGPSWLSCRPGLSGSSRELVVSVACEPAHRATGTTKGTGHPLPPCQSAHRATGTTSSHRRPERRRRPGLPERAEARDDQGHQLTGRTRATRATRTTHSTGPVGSQSDQDGHGDRANKPTG